MSYIFDQSEPVAGERVSNNRLFYIGLDDTNNNRGLIKIRQANGSIVTTSFFQPDEESSEKGKRSIRDMYYRIVDFLQTVYDRKEVTSVLAKAENFQELWNTAMGMFRDKEEEFKDTGITCKFVWSFRNSKYYIGLPRFGACVEPDGFEGESKIKTSDKVDANGIPYDLYEKNIEVEA